MKKQQKSDIVALHYTKHREANKKIPKPFTFFDSASSKMMMVMMLYLWG